MNERKMFLIASKMPIFIRFVLVSVLILVGVIAQLFGDILIGLVPIILSALFIALSTKSTVPENFDHRTKTWAEVTIVEFKKAQEMLIKKGGTGNFGCSCAAMIVFSIFSFIVLSDFLSDVFRPVLEGGSPVFIILIDAWVLLIPILFSGVVTYWKPPLLKFSIQQMLAVYSKCYSNESGLKWIPYMLDAKLDNDKEVPLEAKIMVKIDDAPEDFMGIQIQTGINTVQSSNYPYTYCVLLAKPSFNLCEKAAKNFTFIPQKGRYSDVNEEKEAPLPRFGIFIAEPDKKEDNELVVIRKETKGKGYITSESDAISIFTAALKLARMVTMPEKQDKQ